MRKTNYLPKLKDITLKKSASFHNTTTLLVSWTETESSLKLLNPKSSLNSFGQHNYQRNASVDMHKLKDQLLRKQAAPKLRESDSKDKYYSSVVM